MKKRIIVSFITFVCFALLTESKAQDTITLQHGAHRIGRRQDTMMQRWRGYGLGQFIHFGLYSILGGEYKGEAYNGASEWIRSWGKLPHEVYDSLYKQFNPTKFNADEWAAMAKQMGVKYVTITTRHHDGFCLWPSKYSDYTIAKTPYKKDMIGPLVKAYNKQGIDVYLYYSVLDWHSKDWRYDLKDASDSAVFDTFKIFIKNQLTELLTDYPTVKGLWFDGTWDNSWKKSGAFSDSLEQYLKQLRPGLIIGSRFRADDFGKRHYDSNARLMGDYEQGWERKIPKDFAATHDNDWDCIMTFGENGWGYQNKWLGHWKTSDELVEMMSECVSLDGNFILNFGPKGDGTFRNKETQEAKQIGDWMKINSEAIYNTRYTGWEKQDWGYSTISNDGKEAYLIIFNVPVSGKIRIHTKPSQNISKASFITDTTQSLLIEESDYGYKIITVPPQIYKTPFVIKLNVEQSKQKSKGQEVNKHV